MNGLYTFGHRVLLPGILLIVLLILGACGGQATPSPAAEPTQPAAAEPTQPAAAEPTQPAAAEPTQPAAAEPTQAALPDRATVPAQPDNNLDDDTDSDGTSPTIIGDLSDFDSYRYSITISFDGVNEAGEERQGSIFMSQDVIRETNDHRIQFEVTGMETDADELGNMDMYQIGDMFYLRTTGGTLGDQCLRFQSDEPMPNPAEEFSIEDVVSDIEDAELVEEGVEMNGFITDRYEIGDENFSDVTEEVDSSVGDIWVDQETGHLIKFSGEVVGRDDIEGEQIDGTFLWEYSLEEVNTITEIELPEECVNALDLTDLELDIEGTGSDSE